jgi:putative sterol carrier protein
MSDYPRLKRLFTNKAAAKEASAADVASSMESAAKLLKRGNDVGTVELRVLGDGAERAFTFEVLPGDCRVREAGTESPSLRVVLTDATWAEIANGDLSPVDAYLTGRLEVAGDLGFAKRQYAKLISRGDVDELPI